MSLHQNNYTSQLQDFDSADSGGGKFNHPAIGHHSLIPFLRLFTSNTAQIVSCCDRCTLGHDHCYDLNDWSYIARFDMATT